MTSAEHRKFIRKNALHLLDYLVIDKNGLQTTYSMGRTLDVSENGLKLETTQPISKDDTLLITVDLDDELVELRGEVVYTEDLDQRHITGIEFQDISAIGKKIFKKYTEAFQSMNMHQE
jgi:hypothetical protein